MVLGAYSHIASSIRYGWQTMYLPLLHEDPYGHDDDFEFVFFFVGRLRGEMQTLGSAVVPFSLSLGSRFPYKVTS